MIDKVVIKIPFKEQYVFGDDGVSGLIDLMLCHKHGCKLEAGDVIHTDQGTELGQLRHPFESLPSSWSTLSFKIYKGCEKSWPHVQIKASPAKLLQGHNVYGPTDMHLCISALLESFLVAMPDFAELLDTWNAELHELDVTYTAHLENDAQCRQVMSVLRNISNGQTKSSNSNFETTVYFGRGSRHKVLKAYLKGFELNDQISELERSYQKSKKPHLLKQINAMRHADVQAFAKNAVRFEATLKKAKLKALGVPLLLGHAIEWSEDFSRVNKQCPIAHLWSSAWSDIFKTFDGVDMKTYDDEAVHNKLRDVFKTETKNGFSYSKADRLFGFFRRIKHEGIEEVKATTSRPTYFRHMADLSAVVSKAYLQNLQSEASKVVPILRVINIDFAKQHPSSYVQPLPLSEQWDDQFNLKLVS